MGAIVVALSIVLLRLPVLMGGDSPTTPESLLPLLPFMGVAAFRLMEPVEKFRRARHLGLTILFLLLIVIAGWRAIGPATGYTSHQWRIDTITYVTLAIFGFVIFVRDDLPQRVRAARLALVFAPAVYVAANAILLLGGITTNRVPPPEAKNPAEILGLFGISHLRTFFPLGVGVNTFGITIGAALCMSLVLALRARGRARRFAIAATVISGYAMLLADSRGPLFSALAASFLVVLAGRRFAGRLNRLPFLIPASPFIVFAVLGLLSNSFVAVDVQGRGALATGSNRLYIWKPILNLLGRFDPSQIFGYGAYGQITSGATRGYLYLFRGYSYVPAAHNFVLQTTLDIGYVGLIIVIALMVVSIRSFAEASKVGDVAASALLGGTVYLVLAGFTEAAPTIYSTEAFFFFILLLMAASRISDVPADEQVLASPTSHQPYPSSTTQTQS
jgi:O-antigen ligase